MKHMRHRTTTTAPATRDNLYYTPAEVTIFFVCVTQVLLVHQRKCINSNGECYLRTQQNQENSNDWM